MNWFAIGYACFALVTGGQACMTIEDVVAADGYETADECMARTREMGNDLIERGASVRPQFRGTHQVQDPLCARRGEQAATALQHP